MLRKGPCRHNSCVVCTGPFAAQGCSYKPKRSAMSAIHIKYPALTFKAGDRALRLIRERGLQAADVGVLPGAAGGPKPLGIQGLDLALFGEWLPSAPRPRALIGASIGAWRFASACLEDPIAGLRRLGELYTELDFAKGATPAEISHSCQRMLDDLLQGRDGQLLANPHYHLNILVVKSHGQLAHDHRGRLGLGLGSVVASNLLGRSRLARHFERIILHDGRAAPPLDALTDFPSRYLPLDLANLRHTLHDHGDRTRGEQGVTQVGQVQRQVA